MYIVVYINVVDIIVIVVFIIIVVIIVVFVQTLGLGLVKFQKLIFRRLFGFNVQYDDFNRK